MVQYCLCFWIISIVLNMRHLILSRRWKVAGGQVRWVRWVGNNIQSSRWTRKFEIVRCPDATVNSFDFIRKIIIGLASILKIELRNDHFSTVQLMGLSVCSWSTSTDVASMSFRHPCTPYTFLREHLRNHCICRRSTIFAQNLMHTRCLFRRSIAKSHTHWVHELRLK